MTFNIANLSSVGANVGTGVINLWTFKDSATTKANIEASGYFNAASAFLNVGDVIIFTGSDASGICVVATNSINTQTDPYTNPGVVTVSALV